MMKTGERIARLRTQRGLTQEALGERLGVSFQSVSNWERGESLPETGKLAALAATLGTTADHLLHPDSPELPDWEPENRVFSEERMYTFVKGAAKAAGLAQTLAALPYCRQAHQGQTRKGGEVPYINHLLTMACHALALGIRKDEVLAAILLHDVIEDCPGYTLEDLPVGEAARELVDRLTRTWPSGQGTEAEKRAYYTRIGESPDAAFIKALDRCNNLSLMVTGLSRQKMVRFIEETETYIFPLMEALKNSAPEYNNAMFLVKYQMATTMETVKRLLRG